MPCSKQSKLFVSWLAMIKQGKERCEPGREDRLERVGSKKIIFAWKMHDCLLVLTAEQRGREECLLSWDCCFLAPLPVGDSTRELTRWISSWRVASSYTMHSTHGDRFTGDVSLTVHAQLMQPAQNHSWLQSTMRRHSQKTTHSQFSHRG